VPTNVTINGRFLAAAQTGVQRVASNLVRALDYCVGQTPEDRRREWSLAVPGDVKHPLALNAVKTGRRGALKGQAWEQLELPLEGLRGGLVNLCNMGPLASPSLVTMIHDAQVYLTPESYSRAFIAWYRFAQPRLAAGSRHVLTVSEYSKAQLVRYRVAPEDKILVVPNGVDHMLAVTAEPSIIAKLSLEGRSFVFAFGNLQSHKNLDLLIKAFADPRLADLVLVVVGGVDRAGIETAFGVSPTLNVMLAGRLSDGEVRALMEAAVCLALPSSTEGFGLPALEAMIVGCPALVAPAGALPEMCGDAASYAPLGDLGAWIGAIDDLAGDAGGREERRRKSIDHASKFKWSRAATAIYKLTDALD
jgi:glycosyltransferase involved in cell wall biosynthesis